MKKIKLKVKLRQILPGTIRDIVLAKSYSELKLRKYSIESTKKIIEGIKPIWGAKFGAKKLFKNSSLDTTIKPKVVIT